MPDGLQVLIVGDDPTDADLIVLELRRAGFEPEWKRVDTVADYLSNLHSKLDVILCDYTMPELSGLQALDLLRKRGLEIPFIIVSGSIGEDTAVAAIQHGAADYILKDRMARLGTAVARALDQSRLRNEGEQTNDALRETQEKSTSLLNAALESTADGILVVDVHRNVTSFNQKFLDMWRITPELAVRSDDRELLRFATDQLLDPEGFFAGVEELYRNPQDCSWAELQFLDGRCFERYSQPQRLGGATVGRVWSFRDITERKRAEETLRRTNERVRHLISVLYAIHDVGELLSSKKSSSDLLSAVCQSLVKTRGYVMVWVGEPDEKSMRVVPVAHSGAAGTEFPLRTPITWDDSPFGQGPPGTAIRERRAVVFDDIATEPRFAPWRDEAVAGGCASIASIPIIHDDRLFGALTIKADRTSAFDAEEVVLLSRLAADVGRALRSIEEEAARRKAEEAHARLATAIEQAHESIVITDLSGIIQYVNPFFESISGYTKDEVIGQNPRILKSGKHDEAFYRRMWSALSNGEVWRSRIINKRKDGTLYEEDATISPIVDAAGRTISYVAVKRDISREVQLETQFLQAQKMEAIGQLAGGVAHDFNNILAMILMQTELVGMTEPLPEKARKGLRDISSFAERAAGLTRQLLLFSSRQAMQPRKVDWNELATSLGRMLHRIIGEDVGLRLNLHPEPLMTYADPGMLDQVLLNLVVNARDAMPRGGRILIETGRRTLTAQEADLITNATAGPKVWLRVSDTGNGIPAEILPNIFEPFFTTKELGKGTGLGLSTVFGIVKQHGGLLSVESEVGRGSTFQVYLPGIELAHDTPRETAEVRKSTTGTETILLVEDEEGVRILVRTMLERAGYKVLEASFANEATRIWGQRKDSVDLLILDMVMPQGMNGRELAAWVQGRKPDARIIFISGYNVDSVAPQLSLKQGYNFVQKPFSAQQLLEAIRRRLDE